MEQPRLELGSSSMLILLILLLCSNGYFSEYVLIDTYKVLSSAPSNGEVCLGKHCFQLKLWSLLCIHLTICSIRACVLQACYLEETFVHDFMR